MAGSDFKFIKFQFFCYVAVFRWFILFCFKQNKKKKKKNYVDNILIKKIFKNSNRYEMFMGRLNYIATIMFFYGTEIPC